MARGGYPSLAGRAFGADHDEDAKEVLGRTHGDHEKLFPRYTNATAAHADEIQINGRTLAIWDYAQLEHLNVRILKQRANDLRDALGENNVPPRPSAQATCMIKWILHVQSALTGRTIEAGRGGQGCKVPAHFLHEVNHAPIQDSLKNHDRQGRVAFGQRMRHHLNRDGQEDHNPSRDHYDDLLGQKKEFSSAQKVGIVSQRPGGEGRRPLQQAGHMESSGLSSAMPLGIESLKDAGEGRRYIECVDHVKEQQIEACNGDWNGRSNEPSPRPSGHASFMNSSLGYRSDIVPRYPHVSADHMSGQGMADPQVEPNIGGERRRHIPNGARDHMINHGTADDQKSTAGRKCYDKFKGPGHGHAGSHDSYQAGHAAMNWRKDPSRLMGSSLIV